VLQDVCTEPVAFSGRYGRITFVVRCTHPTCARGSYDRLDRRRQRTRRFFRRGRTHLRYRRGQRAYFDTHVFPALTPLVIQPTQPFPFLSNLSPSLAFVLDDGRTDASVDARVKVPSDVPRWVELTADVAPRAKVFVRLHKVIRENAHTLYPGMRLKHPSSREVGTRSQPSSPTHHRRTRIAAFAVDTLADCCDRSVTTGPRLRWGGATFCWASAWTSSKWAIVVRTGSSGGASIAI
jgi:hypothetical protein